MKKTLLILLAVMAVVCLVSCMSVASFNKLYQGMSKAEVLQLYGNPDSTGYDQNTKTDFFVYYVPSSVFAEDTVDYRIDFKNDAVVSWGQIGHTASTTVQYNYYSTPKK